MLSDDIENFNVNLDERPTVFICNQSGHDFSPSAKYGNPVYVTKGLINRFSVNYMARHWAIALKDSKPRDYILITSLTILTCVGCAIYGYLHGSLNLLLYRNSKYISRRVCFKSLFQAIENKESSDDEQ